LCDLGGNPNKKNGHSETVLHCVCSGSATDQSYAQKLRRDECLLLVLQWNGARLADGTMERVDLVAKDEVDFLFVSMLSCYIEHVTCHRHWVYQ